MNRNVPQKLVVEPELRGGGWKVTPVEFEFKIYKPAKLRSHGKAKRFQTFAEAKAFIDEFYHTERKKFKTV